MKRHILIIFLITLFLISSYSTAFALDNPTHKHISLTILSPDKVKDYPGKEESIKVNVTNNTSVDIHDVLVYITMADIKKNSTVNLEDFSADKPILINTLKANETRILELPIQFVYTSNYYLYTTAVSKEYKETVSSIAIPIEIMGNTKIDKTMVRNVAMSEPIILLIGVAIITIKRKNKIKVK